MGNLWKNFFSFHQQNILLFFLRQMFGRFLRAKFIWSSLEANIERRKHVPSGMIYCFAMLFVFAQTSFTSSLSWSSNCSLLTFLCFLLLRFFFFSVVSIWLSPARSSSRMFLFVLAIWGWNSVSGEVRRGAKRRAFWQLKNHLDRLSFSAKYGRKVGPFYKFSYLRNRWTTWPIWSSKSASVLFKICNDMMAIHGDSYRILKL